MNKLLEVKAVEDIKVVVDPFRMRIMKYISTEGPSTVKKIGDAFNEAPSKILYHMKKLEKVGAVAIVKTEVINGIIAKYYDLIIDEISIVGANENQEAYESVKSAMENQWIKYYDNAKGHMYKILESKKEDKNSDDSKSMDAVIGENYIYLNEDELKQLSSELSDIFKKYMKNPKENRHKYHTLKSIIRVE